MFCIQCGDKIDSDEKFCTSCGKKFVSDSEHIGSKNKYKIGLVILFVVLSVVGLIAYGAYKRINLQSFYIYSTEDEAVNIISNLLEQVGRQKQAWKKSEDITSIYEYALSSECILSESCVNEASRQITTLKAEIQKENEEITNMWGKGTVSEDLKSFYQNLEEKNQLIILKVLNLYFPEEETELSSASAKLL
jgi:hypothetical protein